MNWVLNELNGAIRLMKCGLSNFWDGDVKRELEVEGLHVFNGCSCA